MTDRLPVAVLHLAVQHGRLQENRASLVLHAEQAARSGAKLIVAPELSTSGYSFDGRHQAAACVEELQGETFALLARVARQYGAYLCFGLAERDPATEIYYNSACVIGPDGQLAAHHRKLVVAERRWACPGNPSTRSIVDTPWGRVGVLICADSYYGLLPRALAVHRVDLVVVLANWPPVGLDPRAVWRTRALENGIGVIGCNRTGLDRQMDCRACASYAVTDSGQVLLDAVSATSRVLMVDYPLVDGRLPAARREAIMARRRHDTFAALYLDVNALEDFSGLWRLPKSGEIDVRCIVPEFSEQTAAALAAAVAEIGGQPTLLVLPRGGSPLPHQLVLDLVRHRPVAVAAELDGQSAQGCGYGLVCADRPTALLDDNGTVLADFGPARIALLHPEVLRHPEPAVALSKQGCDLAVAGMERLQPDDRLVLGAKCLERLAVVLAARDGAAVCEPPIGHAPWKETALHGPGVCTARIDTGPLRTKRFQDRVDMEALLRR